MVPSPNGVVMIGGHSSRETGMIKLSKILELSSESTVDKLKWTELNQKTEFPRSGHISFIIPKEICEPTTTPTTLTSTTSYEPTTTSRTWSTVTITPTPTPTTTSRTLSTMTTNTPVPSWSPLSLIISIV